MMKIFKLLPQRHNYKYNLCEMGLGPSLAMECKRCNNHQNVNYILVVTHDKSLDEKLRSWWIQTNIYDMESTYVACKYCFNDIPRQYQGLFTYNESLVFRGM